MRHDRTTTPTTATASTIASSPSARIDALEGKVRRWAQRAGQLEPGQDWGWCTPCGRNRVFAFDGEDTCRACTAELAAERARRQP